MEAGIKYYKMRFFFDYVKIGTADENKKADDLARSYEAALRLLPNHMYGISGNCQKNNLDGNF